MALVHVVVAAVQCCLEVDAVRVCTHDNYAVHLMKGNGETHCPLLCPCGKCVAQSSVYKVMT